MPNARTFNVHVFFILYIRAICAMKTSNGQAVLELKKKTFSKHHRYNLIKGKGV